MKVIDDDDASLLPKIGADGFPLRGTVTRARDCIVRIHVWPDPHTTKLIHLRTYIGLESNSVVYY